MASQSNGTPLNGERQDIEKRTDAAIRAFAAACLRLLRVGGGLKTARTSMAAAASSEDWGLEGGRFTADGRQLNWPLSTVIAEMLEEREDARNELQAAVKLLLDVDLNPAQWARVAGEFWE